MNIKDTAEALTEVVEGDITAGADRAMDLPAEYDMSIHSNPDALAWTEFFFKTFPDCNVDHETMFGWFANAMVARGDHVHRQIKNDVEANA